MRQTILKLLGAWPDLEDDIRGQHNDDLAVVRDISNTWFLLGVALVVGLVSFAADLVSCDASQNWFGRSGAILVAAGTWNELRTSAYFYNSDVEIDLSWKHDSEDSADRFLLFTKHARWIGWTFIVAGTGIWAYGDLVFWWKN